MGVPQKYTSYTYRHWRVTDNDTQLGMIEDRVNPSSTDNRKLRLCIKYIAKRTASRMKFVPTIDAVLRGTLSHLDTTP